MRLGTVRRIGRRTGVVIAVCGLLFTAACSGGGSDEPSSPSTEPDASSVSTSAAASTAASPTAPSSLTSVPPVAEAGGICQKVTYAEVTTALGLTFQAAAASGKNGGVQTCVLLPIGAALPDLTFVATPLDDEVTEDDYAADFVPEGSDDQDGLGRAAYRDVIVATAKAGPTAQIGWLGKRAAYTLSLTTTKGTAVAGAAAFLVKLVTLAPKLTS